MCHQHFSTDVAQILTKAQRGFTPTLLPGSPLLSDLAEVWTLEPELTPSSTTC